MGSFCSDNDEDEYSQLVQVVSSVSSFDPRLKIIEKGYKPAERWEPDIDGLTFLGILGSGSFGDVFKGKDVKTNLTCAVKCLEIVEEDMNDIIREIRMLSNLCHQNLMDIYFATILNRSVLCLCMPLCYGLGEVIKDIVDTRPEHQWWCISEPTVRILISQLLEGLSFIHSHGYAHRDIKSDNLMIDDHSVLKITDFGISTQFDPSENPLGAMKTPMGTKIFMAPEVMEGFMVGRKHWKKYDLRSETWSVAMVVFEMVFGVLPFDYLRKQKNSDKKLAQAFDELQSRSLLHFDFLYHGESHLFNEGRLTGPCIQFVTSCLTGSARRRPTCADLRKFDWMEIKDPYAKTRIRNEILNCVTIRTIREMKSMGYDERESDRIQKLYRDEVVVLLMVPNNGKTTYIRFVVDLEGTSPRKVEKLSRKKLLALCTKKILLPSEYLTTVMTIVQACAIFLKKITVELIYDMYQLEMKQKKKSVLENNCLIIVTKSLGHTQKMIESSAPLERLEHYREKKSKTMFLKKVDDFESNSEAVNDEFIGFYSDDDDEFSEEEESDYTSESGSEEEDSESEEETKTARTRGGRRQRRTHGVVKKKGLFKVLVLKPIGEIRKVVRGLGCRY